MGALHEGHLSLIKQAKNVADICICSIYINPKQFNRKSDLKAYPRTLEKDAKLLEENDCDLVFAPSNSEIYGENFQSEVSVLNLTKPLEGSFRPGHFLGVTTIVNILFNITEANFAIFGEKDFQQLRIIETMVADLKMRIKIIRAKLIREESGLALSSRNTLLSDKEKKDALLLSKSLLKAREAFIEGQKESGKLKEIINNELSISKILKLDYLEIADENLNKVKIASSKSRILIASYCGNVRLIDNIEL
ncbi:UNVERIFIED_CONTAM: hypothetical protein GTU68_034336 [Idotea baltica]|nr:hypothetical protein [Idotea baltica]